MGRRLRYCKRVAITLSVAAAAGPVAQKELIVCIQINSPRARHPIALIDRILPALRRHPDGSTSRTLPDYSPASGPKS